MPANMPVAFAGFFTEWTRFGLSDQAEAQGEAIQFPFDNPAGIRVFFCYNPPILFLEFYS